MLLDHARQHRLGLQCLDSMLACLAFAVAFGIRDWLLPYLPAFELNYIGSFSMYAKFLPLLLAASPLILFRLNFYSQSVKQHLSHVVNLALQASLILFLLMVVTQFLIQVQLSRLVFIIFVPTYAACLCLREFVTRWWRLRIAEGGAHRHSLMVVSDRPGSTTWPEYLDSHPEFAFRVADEMSLENFDLAGFIDRLHQGSIELVIFDIRKGSIQKVTEAIQACEQEGIEVWMTTGFIETSLAQLKVDYIAGLPVLIFRSTPDSSWQLLLKNLVDRIGAAALLVCSSPMFAVIAAVIRITSPGPVFFRQERSGRYGRPFLMYKFRSMVSNAEQTRQELQQYNEMSGPVFKISKDPRVTPFGRWLRATSLDELPQLWNVLRGEMSLVGPRPLPVYETLAMSENAQRRRLSVKPGLTCLWQVCGRNEVSDFKDWVRMDLEYIDRWSLGLDFEILFKTIPAVLARRGAK
ncbi:MAG: sugar transferase [Candidatus Methylacidiphilales bacterium]|nr:sugar transferase [Candidatus Methylacidiphilales bacterium]